MNHLAIQQALPIKRRAIASVLALGVVTLVQGQGVIRGKVMDESQQPISAGTVELSYNKQSFTTITDSTGLFIINVPATGRYELRIATIGFNPFVQAYTIGKDTTYVGELVLTSSIRVLPSIEVTGRNARKYESEYSFSATKIAELNKNIPQSIATITKELLADRQAFQIADAVKNTSGVIPASYYNQFTIRGISQNEEGTIINGMRTRQNYFTQPLTNNLERVEVIKGPASATFSSVDPGGSINLVTKKPLAVDRKEISLTAGSFSTIRSTLDFTGPMNKAKTLLYRLNAGFQQARSFRDLQSQKAILLTPSFTYLPNDKTVLNVELIYSDMNTKLDRGQAIFGAIAGQTDLKSTPTSFNIGASNDYFKSKEVVVMSSLAHKLTRNLTFNTAYMKQTWSEDLLEHRTTNAFAVDINNRPVPTLAAMQTVQRQQFWNTDNLSTYLNAVVTTGSVEHKVLVGYDYIGTHKFKGGSQNVARGYVLTNGSVVNTYNPANSAQYQMITVGGVQLPKPNVEHFNLANPVYTIKNINEYVFTKAAIPAALYSVHAAYVQEQLKWKKLTLLLSLRQEWYEDITNYKSNNEIATERSKLLPRVGLVYAVLPTVNFYATYLKGYQPHSNTTSLMPVPAPAGTNYEPLISDLKEAGFKSDWLHNKLQLTVAFYEINQRNILMNANDPVDPDLLVTRGAERSRGVDVDVTGFIKTNWQVTASYSYIDAIIVEDNNKALIGARKQNTPVNSANLWTRYNFHSHSILKDLGIGIGLQYSGDKIPWLVRDFTLPAYTLLDAALYYAPAKSSIQLALNVNNLADKTYWIGAQNYLRLFPGAPRNLLLSATYKF
jgi:iron complex outermembrane receptor protein